MTLDDTFGSRLARARMDKELSQADLAELTGIAAAQISRYESGKNIPRGGSVAKLARALSVSMHWLNTGEIPWGEDLGPELRIRLPAHIYLQLEEAAKLSDQSLHAEIVKRLTWAVTLLDKPKTLARQPDISGDIPWSMRQDINDLANESNVTFEEMLARLFVAGIHKNAPQVLYLPIVPGAKMEDLRAAMEAAKGYVRPDATIVSEKVAYTPVADLLKKEIEESKRNEAP